MHSYLIEMLECPVCHGELVWTIIDRLGTRIETAGAHCRVCAATYPVRKGIGLFLTSDLPRKDLWEQVDSQLMVYLSEHPEVEQQLLDGPLDTLTPADQFFRALVMEERGDYAQAKTTADLAHVGLYTPEYLTCYENQVNYVVERLSVVDGPIIDLCSGRGYLVEELARRLKQPIVATDFSPRVLQRDRRWLKFFDLYDRVSLLAFDARCTPFKNGVVETLTTNLGLSSIEEPGNLLQELRRIVTGTLLAISQFYPENDEVNAEEIRKTGLSTLLFRHTALECFADAGWEVEVVNVCTGKAYPTPTSVILKGAGIDVFPVAETMLEWCVLVAR